MTYKDMPMVRFSMRRSRNVHDQGSQKTVTGKRRIVKKNSTSIHAFISRIVELRSSALELLVSSVCRLHTWCYNRSCPDKMRPNCLLEAVRILVDRPVGGPCSLHSRAFGLAWIRRWTLAVDAKACGGVLKRMEAYSFCRAPQTFQTTTN
jgi:hypothetical protein